MLDKEFKYFVNHHDEIFAEYPNMFVVVAAADTFDDALINAINMGFVPGTFLIQECTEGDDAYTQTFHTRVVFA